MGIGTDGNVIISSFQNISAVLCLDALTVIRSHVLKWNGEFDCLALSRLQFFCLLILDQVYGSFLNAAVCIRRCVINFYHIFSCNITGVGDFYIKGNCVITHVEIFHFLRESRVGKSVSKRIFYIVVILDQAFFCGGLVEFITYVNAFHVIYESHISFISTICFCDGLFQVFDILIREVPKVVIGWGLGKVFYKSICGFSRWVHSTIQDLTKCRHTSLTSSRCQDHSSDGIIIIHPVQFHGVV